MTNPNAYYAGGLGVSMYDLFTGGGLLAGDVEFYLDCAQRFGGPILELGAGTGRILVPLAEAGYDMVGLDLSPVMLELAAAKLGERPEAAKRARLLEGDMADFDLGRQFALVLVPARSFKHITTPAGQRATLQSIRRHTMAGGHLVLGLFDPNFEILFAKDDTDPPSREARDPLTDALVRRSVVARQTNPSQQTIQEALRFEIFDPSGNVVAVEETSWTLRWSMRQEIAWLLELCGFEVVELFSDFKKSPADYGREQLWIARAV